jgi:hypothetical protein
MQTHALTRMRYFYSLNVITSHPIVHKEGLGYLSVFAYWVLVTHDICVENIFIMGPLALWNIKKFFDL